MRHVGILAIVLASLFTLAGGPAVADDLRPGYLELTQRDAARWDVIWKAPVAGGMAGRARPLLPSFCDYSITEAHLRGASIVSAGTAICSRPLAENRVGLAGMERGFGDALLRVAALDRAVQVERLTPDRPAVAIAAASSGWQVARTYLLLGIEHILAGYDHLLFVIALVLLLRRGWIVVKAATAFTVAHSITLAGTTLGVFGLERGPIEALIALSIVFLAVEIVKQVPGDPRLSERASWMVAFLFGLLHGFGFAGALREIGLPEGDVFVALLTFNLGVEAGQLLIVTAALAVMALLRRTAPGVVRPAVVVAAYGIGTISAFWLLERLTT